MAQDEKLFQSYTIPSDLKENANAVIRFNKIEVIIDLQDEMKINLRRIVTVFNELGNKDVQAIVGYDKNRKIKKIQAVIFDQNGKEIKKIKKSDFIDHSAVDGGTLYSDSRVLFMPYTPIQYPYTVDFYFEIESKNTADIPTWRPIESYYLGIENSSYSVIDKGNVGLRYNEVNFNDFIIDSEAKEGVLIYAINNISAIKPEEHSPSLSAFTPKVMIAANKFHFDGVYGEAKDWNEFGDWIFDSLLLGRNQVSEKTKAHVLDITSNITDPIEKARKVYEFVQNNTRYISVQVGIGGIQPISALDVDNLKYGDCKGLTNYTQALLKIVGVESFYTIVEAGNEIEDLDENFASLEQGNHIILGIPNDDSMVWLDCTSQIHPFGFIGDFTDSRKVFQIRPNNSLILKTTVYENEQNYQQTKASIIINSDASVNAEIEIKSKGIQYDDKFIIEKESQDNVLKYYKGYWNYINNLNIESYIFNNNNIEVEFIEKVTLKVNDYSSINNGRLIFAPNIFNRNNYVPDRYRTRNLPLLIQRGFFDEDEFHFTIPNNYNVEAVPENTSITNKFGEYAINTKINENEIIFTRKLLIKKGNYSKDEYEEYRSFRKEISKFDSSIIILKKQN